MDYVIQCNNVGWYIYGVAQRGWLSREEDKFIQNDVYTASNSMAWPGYYNTKEEAEHRLNLYKRGISINTIIHLGGE